MLYGIFDYNEKLIACHKKKKPIEWFFRYNYPDFPHLYIKRFKPKKYAKYIVDDAYLAHQGNGYLQYKYLDYVQVFNLDEKQKDKETKKHLIQVLGTRELNKHQMNVLKEAILLLDEFIDTGEYTIPYKQAIELKLQYEEYKYHSTQLDKDEDFLK